MPLTTNSRRRPPAVTAAGVEHKHVSIQSPALVRTKSGAGSRPQATTRGAWRGQKPVADGGDVDRGAKMVGDQLRQLEQLVEEKKKEKEVADMKVAIRNSLAHDRHHRKAKAPLASPVLQKPHLDHGRVTPLDL